MNNNQQPQRPPQQTAQQAPQAPSQPIAIPARVIVVYPTNQYCPHYVAGANGQMYYAPNLAAQGWWRYPFP